MQFFGILSRHFVESFFGQLSRPALHVYAYLRTWCTSPAGQASAWVPIRVAKIADAIGRCTRQVRRGLAELRAARLIESEAVFEEGAQRANRLRVLPEPGYLERAPGPPPVTPPPVEHEEVVVEEVPVLDAVADEVVAAVPAWASEALAATEDAERDLEQLVAELADGTVDAEVWGAPGTPRREAIERQAPGMLAAARRDVESARAAVADVRAALQYPDLWRTVVSTTIARARREIVARGGTRRDAKELASQAGCEAAIWRAVARR